MRTQLAGMAILDLLGSPSAMAAGSDEIWEVTSKMEMPGMPMAMPGQAAKVCLKKGNEKDPNNAIPKDRDRRMSDVKVASRLNSPRTVASNS